MFLENLFLVARPFAGTKKINFCLLQDAQTAAILSGYACNVTDIVMAFNEQYLSPQRGHVYFPVIPHIEQNDLGGYMFVWALILMKLGNTFSSKFSSLIIFYKLKFLLTLLSFLVFLVIFFFLFIFF